MRKQRLSVAVAAAVAMFAGQALAGEEPYVASVHDDDMTNDFYNSPKLDQQDVFVHSSTDFQPPAFPIFPPGIVPLVADELAGEAHKASKAIDQPEVCDADQDESGNPNSRVGAGNAGWWQWDIVLPKKPTTNPVIYLQCGVVKPDAVAFLTPQNAIKTCSAETGEMSQGLCNRRRSKDKPGGKLAYKPGGLPQVTAVAYRGPFNADPGDDWFYLTAFKNPGQYASTTTPAGALRNSFSTVILNGSRNARVSLNACMPKTLTVRFPVSGQVNADGQTEFTLNEGDGIRVRMDVPNVNTVDIYCHVESAKVMGQGEPESLITD